jgi:hypothetical protein
MTAIAGNARAAAGAATAVLVMAACLIFVRLDQRLLWVDEAETALLGRNVLAYGVPKAFDGKTLVSQEVGREFGSNYVWRWTPWLEKYLAAASFAVLGESTFSARLPFALVGLLAVASVYPLALALFRDRWVGVLAMAFLSLSVPFILHVRQCRYYSLLAFGTIWALYFVVGLGRGRRGAIAGFATAMTVLFHANTLAFLATSVALAPCALVFGFERAALVRSVKAVALIVLVNGPWLYFFMLGKSGETLYPFAENLRYQANLASQYTLPVVAIPLFLGLAWALRPTHRLLDGTTWRPFAALVVIPLVFIVGLATAPWSFYRYTVGLLPLAAVLLAFMCVQVVRWSRLVGIACTATLLLTGVAGKVSAWPIPPLTYTLQTDGRSFPLCDTWFPLGNYLYEVTHPFTGPMETLVAYLEANARPGDRVFVSYGDLIVAFYTNLEVRGGQSGRSLDDWPLPDWLVLRSFFRFGDRAVQKADAQRMVAWLKEKVPPDDYEQVPIAGMDFPWDDIAEPDLHWFRVPVGGKSMELYRRAAPPAS